MQRVDGITVVPLAGSLGTTYATQSLPRLGEIIPLTPITPTRVQVLYPRIEVERPVNQSCMVAWSYATFYNLPNTDPSPENMVGGIISLLNCVVPALYIVDHGDVIEKMRLAGLSPDYIEIRTLADLRVLRTEETERFIDQFNHADLEHFMHSRDQQVLLFGLLLLAMVKNVTPENYSGWINARLRSFRGSLGIPEGTCIWTEGNCPSQAALAAFHSFMSSSHDLRCSILSRVLAISHGRNRICNLFKTVMQLLRGAEMSHLTYIDQLIIAKYPEILRLRVVRDNLANYNQALQYLATLDTDQRLFAKLLQPREATGVLNRNNFTSLTSAAIAIAQYELPSMKNYRGGKSDATHGAIQKVVTQYLTFRTSYGYLSIYRSPYAYMSSQERELYAEHCKGNSIAEPDQGHQLVTTTQPPPLPPVRD